MPYFILQVPLKVKRAEAELAEFMEERAIEKLSMPDLFATAHATTQTVVSPRKKKKKVKAEEKERLEKERFEDNPVLSNIKIILENHPAVGTVTWIEQPKPNQVFIAFAVSGEGPAESILNDLKMFGVGVHFGNLSVTPLEAQFPKKFSDSDGETTFWETMKSRVMVEQVVRQTQAQAVFSFDFLCLCIVASILAAIGLAVNSPVVVVASMLVSPIMGPILAVTFGSVVRDFRLLKVGLLSELMSLLICVFDGFIVGLIFSPYADYFEWPSQEMAGRGTTTGLIVGLGIALPSGVGVALSVLGNNTSSLVGVAISASLLPPAVNCGMCYAYALVGPYLNDNVDSVQYFNIGSISFLLTILNILCVYGAAVFMYKLKEIAPLPNKSHFWAKDVPLARNYTAALDPASASKMQEMLTRELARLNNGKTITSLNEATYVGGSLTYVPGDPKREQLMRASDSKIDYPSDDDDDDEHKGAPKRLASLFTPPEEKKEEPADEGEMPESLQGLFGSPPKSPEGESSSSSSTTHRKKKKRTSKKE